MVTILLLNTWLESTSVSRYRVHASDQVSIKKPCTLSSSYEETRTHVTPSASTESQITHGFCYWMILHMKSELFVNFEFPCQWSHPLSRMMESWLYQGLAPKCKPLWRMCVCEAKLRYVTGWIWKVTRHTNYFYTCQTFSHRSFSIYLQIKVTILMHRRIKEGVAVV